MSGLAPSALESLAAQLSRMEGRAGRRAVRVSVSVPVGVDVSAVQAALVRLLHPGRTDVPDIELIVTLDGTPRLLTVDFDMPGAV